MLVIEHFLAHLIIGLIYELCEIIYLVDWTNEPFHHDNTTRHKLNSFKTRLSDKDIRDGRRCECLPLPMIKLTFVSELAMANIDAM